jgi:hypothetical protein
LEEGLAALTLFAPERCVHRAPKQRGRVSRRETDCKKSHLNRPSKWYRQAKFDLRKKEEVNSGEEVFATDFMSVVNRLWHY